MNGWSWRLMTSAATRHRLAWVLALMLVSVTAVAAEPGEVRAAERVVEVGNELVALQDSDDRALARELERIEQREASPLVHAWIAAMRIDRARRADHLTDARSSFLGRVDSRQPTYAALLADLDTLIGKKLERFAISKPKEVVRYSLSGPLPRSAVDRLREGNRMWVVRTLVADPDPTMRRAAAAVLPLVDGPDRELLNEYIAMLAPPAMITEEVEHPPWRGGPLFQPSTPLTDDEREELGRSLERWIRWGIARDRQDVVGPARNVLWGVDQARAMELR